jgi:hypothetical protein
MTTKATCTVLLVTDGHRSTYGVMVGPLVEPRNRPAYFDANRATIIARVTVERPASLPPGGFDYVATTEAHATPDAPAVPWQSAPRRVM